MNRNYTPNLAKWIWNWPVKRLSLSHILCIAMTCGGAYTGQVNGGESTDSPNILFISIDDLNDWVGFLGGHPQVKTPHMDALARRGIHFTEAHCPAPVCGPSRAAVMSGMRPWTTGIYSNDANFDKFLPEVTSIPSYFRKNGYVVSGAGKLFHGGISDRHFNFYAPPHSHPYPKESIRSSFQKPVYKWETEGKVIEFPRNGMPADRIWKDTHTFDWGHLDIDEDRFRDAQNVAWIEKQIAGIKKGTPKFMGLGFHLPHQPLYAPKRFHDMYPLDSVELPPVISGDLDDLSRAGKDYALIATTSGLHSSVVKHGEWKHAVSSYLATVTFVDHLIGKVVQALERSELAGNTWIFLWSDHGWHLGEKQHWGKATGWNRSTRVPMMVIPPSERTDLDPSRGLACRAPVNLIDLFPTLVNIAGLKKIPYHDGKSLLPLIQNPKAPWSDHTTTTFGRGNHSISTRQWKFIHYFDGTYELYDKFADPHEWTNLAYIPAFQNVVSRLKKRLPEEPRWRYFVRYNQFKAVIPSDGSPMLLFNHAIENHLEERTSEAADFPEIVTYIQNWLDVRRPESKYLTIGQP